MNILPLPNKPLSSRLHPSLSNQPEVHRNNHGGFGFLSNDRILHQPQDGASMTAARILGITGRMNRALGEAEDARLTGGTRSLMRRLLGLNLTHRHTPPMTRVA